MVIRSSVGSAMTSGGPWLPVVGARLGRPAMLGSEFRHAVRILRQVPDHPGIVHAITGCGALRMIKSGWNRDRVILPDLHDALADLGMAVTFRARKPVVVDLGLRMVVRRIARPPPLQGDDFAEHQIGIGR